MKVCLPQFSYNNTNLFYCDHVNILDSRDCVARTDCWKNINVIPETSKGGKRFRTKNELNKIETGAYQKTQIAKRICTNAHILCVWREVLCKFTQIMCNLHKSCSMRGSVNQPAQIANHIYTHSFSSFMISPPIFLPRTQALDLISCHYV
jgi:hypothetical protein